MDPRQDALPFLAAAAADGSGRSQREDRNRALLAASSKLAVEEEGLCRKLITRELVWQETTTVI